MDETAQDQAPEGDEFFAAPPPGWQEVAVEKHEKPRVSIGLIALANDCAIESDFRNFADAPGVRVYTNRVYSPLHSNMESLVAVQDDIADSLVNLMPDEHLDVVAFGCTSATMANGEQCVVDAVLSKRPDVKVTDPITAGLEGLRRLGCNRIALLTPYIGEVNLMVERYISSKGANVVSRGFFRVFDDNERSRVTLDAFMNAGRELVRQNEAEALFISCTALTTAPVVEALEQEIGMPVVTSNQALAWSSLRESGYNDPLMGRGVLMRTN